MQTSSPKENTDKELSAISALLSSIFLCAPTKDAIEQWRDLLADDHPSALDDLRDVLNGIDTASAQSLEDILWDHTSLFIGPHKLPCPPWESVYTSPKKLMMQEAYQAVKELYFEAGFVVSGAAIHYDHIGAELNFLSLLFRKLDTATGERERYLALAKRFYSEHLDRWVYVFLEDMTKAAGTQLYRSLASATKAHMKNIGETCSPSRPFPVCI